MFCGFLRWLASMVHGQLWTKAVKCISYSPGISHYENVCHILVISFKTEKWSNTVIFFMEVTIVSGITLIVLFLTLLP